MSQGKNVSIHTKTSQIDADGQKSDMEFFAEGSYKEIGGTKYLTYKESEISGMEGTTTTIKINPDHLSIIRFGSINSKLEFMKDTVTRTMYSTPYGQFDIIIDTKLLEMDIQQEEKSTIRLKYTLDSGMEQVMTNDMTISFK